MNEPKQSSRENVVPLKSGQKPPSGIPSLARLPAPVHALREKARRHLQQLLHELFDQADDALFDLADQAANNQEQNLYFESMREVRLERRKLEANLFQHLDRGFAQLLDSAAAQAAESTDEMSLEDLSLVQNDELEAQVARDNLINKANDAYAESLQHLIMRIDQLVPVKVYQKNNPLGPNRLCGGFAAGLEALSIDIKARLVLFKLFDKVVVARLGKVYQELNQLLIDANILPSLKPGRPGVALRPGRSGATGRGGPGTAASSDDSAEQVLHTLRGLLAESQEPAGAGSGQGSTQSDYGSGAQMASDDLVQALSRAQQESRQQLGQSGPLDFKALLSDLQRGQKQQQINPLDQDVINLVSMMFEFILDDRNLADPMKALLGRLQIPLVKVAIADKSFFSKGGHPARRLLNEMAMAALGWQDTGEENRRKDNLYKKIEVTVQAILSGFDRDIGIFERLLLDFRSFQEKERRRAQILEQRTLDAEDGKARAERARTQVDSALAEITRGRDLPEAAQRLLQDAWAKVLFIIGLKQGSGSEEWCQALAQAEDLVWSATAPMDKDNRQRLLKLVPRLLPQLRAGLESINYNAFEQTQLFKQLEQLHLSRLRVQPSREPAEQTPESEAGDIRDQQVPEEAPSEAPSKKEEPLSEVFEPEVHSEPESQKPAPDLADSPDSESVSPGAEPPAPEIAETPLAPDDPHWALVSNLTQGSWFEMQAEANQVYRCRLAAMIKPTGKYIFVNRSGMKVAEETREGLARALKTGRLRLLDDGMLFDRALEAVIGNLRSARAH